MAGALACFGITGAQFSHRTVQHFLAQAARQVFQDGLDWLTPGQRLLRPCQFGRAPQFCLGIELLDQRHAGALVNPVPKTLNAGVNNRFESPAPPIGAFGGVRVSF